MTTEKTLRGHADLKLLAGVVSSFFAYRAPGSIIVLLCLALERHTEVGAYDIHNCLPVLRVVLCEAFQRIQSTQSDFGPIVSKLLNGLGVQFGDSALYGIKGSVPRNVLAMQLSAECQQKSASCPNARADAKANLDGLNLQSGAVPCD